MLQSHGHRRTSSWGRTYSFSSAISRGFLTEEQNRDVKAGIQPTLQVCVYVQRCVFIPTSWHFVRRISSTYRVHSCFTVVLLCLCVLLFAQPYCFHMCRCSWPTHPMCSCWSHARMYLNSWITRSRCARVFSASTGTWSWSTRWIRRHGQWDVGRFFTIIPWYTIILDTVLVNCLCSAGSRCCRCCWGSQRQWWRGLRKTKKMTALLKV